MTSGLPDYFLNYKSGHYEPKPPNDYLNIYHLPRVEGDIYFGRELRLNLSVLFVIIPFA